MSLREDLELSTTSFFDHKTERAKARQEVKAIRAAEDVELGRKHGLEDIPMIVANIKQAALNGVQEYEFEIAQSLDGILPPYGQGYQEAVRAYMNDHNIGMYGHTSGAGTNDRVTVHHLYVYWR